LGLAQLARRSRLLRHCAGPPFALERLEQFADDQLVYHFPKPRPDGSMCLRPKPLELIERLAALILLSRRAAIITHKVLAPNSRYPTAGSGL
jgi:hypothetical protein